MQIQDDQVDADLMKKLKENGSYEITPAMREKLGDFYGNFAAEQEAAAVIRDLYEKTGYVVDPHTAVAACVWKKYRKESGDERKTVIASTASPYKFTRSVMEAIGQDCSGKDDFELVDELARISGTEVPRAVEEIRTAPVLHDTVVEIDGMKAAVKNFLK